MPPSSLERFDQPIWRAFDIDDEGRILAGHDAGGTLQLCELAPGGGAVPLTALEGGCRGRYLPGRRLVVVEHDEGGNERNQLSLLQLEPAPAAPARPGQLSRLVHDPRYFHNLLEVGRGEVIYATNRRNGTDFDVVVHELEGGAERVVYGAGGNIEEFALSPDRQWAVLTRVGERPMSSQLLLLEVASGALRPLTGAAERAQHMRVRWLPDSRSLVVTSDRRREFTAAFRLELPSGRWTELVSAPGHDVSAWPSPDGRLLLALTDDDGVAQLSLHRGATGELRRRLQLPTAGWTGEWPLSPPRWSPDSSRLTLSLTAPTLPEDVLLVETRGGRVRTVASSAPGLAGSGAVEPSFHRVEAPGGERIPCFLYPAREGAERSLQGSSVVFIHGGPESHSVRRFNPLIQALSAQGHAVLVPNVRGSSGFGKRWYSADDGRRRLDSVADLEALHAWLPRLGLDPRRAALWGGSYGGYMVLAGLAFQPRLWAAGVDIVGISSLLTFLEHTSPYRRASREREYGSLERDRDFLEAASPLNQADRIRAPLFIIHGANDPRVPLSEAEQVAKAVRANQVECELLVYPDEGHGLARRENRLDGFARAISFLSRHLRREPLGAGQGT